MILTAVRRFLWAALRTRQLLALNVDDITRSAARMLSTPQEIMDIYQRADDKILKLDQKDQVIGRRALKLVLCAAHPLTSDELLYALRIDPEIEDFMWAAEIDEDWLRYLWPDILALGSHADLGLIWMPTHSSCAQFFTGIELEAHLDAARICLKLLLETYRSPKRYEESPMAAEQLVVYARHHWATHVRAGEDHPDVPDPVLAGLMKEFLGSPQRSSRQYQGWYKAVENDIRQLPPTSDFDQSVLGFIAPDDQALFAMCRFSLFKLLEDWWRDPALDLSKTNRQNQTLLQVVDINDPASILIGRRLVELGADVNQLQVGDYTTALASAVAIGDAEWVELLLAHGADPDEGSPLVVAAMKNRPDLVRILLQAGAQVNTDHRALGFGSVLVAAAACAGLETITILLSAGADVHKTLDRSVASVVAAVGRNRSVDVPEIVPLLVRHGADVNLLGGENGSALAEACLWGNLACLTSLIQAGARVNQKLDSGNYGSALATAAFSGAVRCVEALIEAGADVNQELEAGNYGSSLAAAACGGHLACVRVLLRAGANVNQALAVGDYGSALAAAAAAGRLECLIALLEGEADPGQLLPEGKYGSALAAAAHAGHEACVRALVQAGADINQLLPHKTLGSALAASIGQENCMAVLTSAGADVNQLLPPDGCSVLALAAERGRVSSLEVLISAGADVNLLHRSERARCGSALVAAAFGGFEFCVKALIRAGASVNQEMLVGVYGNALMAAAGQGKLQCLEVLVAAGADVNKQVNQHLWPCQTALATAAYLGRLYCAAALIRHGAAVDLHLEGHFRSALHAAETPVSAEHIRMYLRSVRPRKYLNKVMDKGLVVDKEDVAELLRGYAAGTWEVGS